MRTVGGIVAIIVCGSLANNAFSADQLIGYTVKYSGGSLPSIGSGQNLKLYLDRERIVLVHDKDAPITITSSAITEVSYGQEVHRRVGTAVGLAVISLGIGALTALSKSKKHYIGVVWEDGANKGGFVMQADKNEYRGIIAGLEGVSGKKAVNTDPPAK